jgi:hypothetical protein
MKKTLDQKLQLLKKDSSADTFILADAKDPDMARGVASFGQPWPLDPKNPKRMRSVEEFKDQIREIVDKELVDIMLTSASTMYHLEHKERLFASSKVTPAVRVNDTSDVWVGREMKYATEPAKQFSSCYLDEAKYGSLTAKSTGKARVDLGLYSITFNNNLAIDHANLEKFHTFRAEAERKKFRYFLEVFDPNVDIGISADKIPGYVNDCIVRTLAGVPKTGRPEFLKMVYHGPKALEELVNYDSSIIIGILGGGAGTTYDAFKLVAEAKKYGARVALFGRKILMAECPLTFIKHMRMIVDKGMDPAEAVKAYHGQLQKMKITAKRSLQEDLKITETVLRY